MSANHPPSPALTVDVAVIAGEGAARSILLIERAHDPDRGAWALPGGFVEAGERVEAAARRELLEETGLEVGASATRLLGVYDTPGRDPRGPTVSIVYVVALPAAVAVLGGDDAASARWFGVGELPALAFDHALIVADALRAG